MHRIAKVAVLVAAAVAFSAPVANADRSYIYNSYSDDVTDWHTGVGWGGAMARDMDQDGNSVKAPSPPGWWSLAPSASPSAVSSSPSFALRSQHAGAESGALQMTDAT
ncbi:hypothetical protein ACWGVR_10375 [Streptomyces xanthophaeus]